ncbi:hypothetical protein [Jannaschia faecimaris]|nr:hypothetical protein [Jannaschia faecimaris]
MLDRKGQVFLPLSSWLKHLPQQSADQIDAVTERIAPGGLMPT